MLLLIPKMMAYARACCCFSLVVLARACAPPPKRAGFHKNFTEADYQLVAALASNEAMAAFVKKFLAQSGRHVTDEGDLNGFVPHYSGAVAVQSFTRMKEELNRANWTGCIASSDKSLGTISHIAGDSASKHRRGGGTDSEGATNGQLVKGSPALQSLGGEPVSAAVPSKVSPVLQSLGGASESKAKPAKASSALQSLGGSSKLKAKPASGSPLGGTSKLKAKPASGSPSLQSWGGAPESKVKPGSLRPFLQAQGAAPVSKTEPVKGSPSLQAPGAAPVSKTKPVKGSPSLQARDAVRASKAKPAAAGNGDQRSNLRGASVSRVSKNARSQQPPPTLKAAARKYEREAAAGKSRVERLRANEARLATLRDRAVRAYEASKSKLKAAVDEFKGVGAFSVEVLQAKPDALNITARGVAVPRVIAKPPAKSKAHVVGGASTRTISTLSNSRSSGGSTSSSSSSTTRSSTTNTSTISTSPNAIRSISVRSHKGSILTADSSTVTAAPTSDVIRYHVKLSM